MFKLGKCKSRILGLLLFFILGTLTPVSNLEKTSNFPKNYIEESKTVFSFRDKGLSFFAKRDNRKREPIKVYPGGNVVALKMNTDGVLVLSIGHVKNNNGEILQPARGKLKAGDIIYKVNNKVIQNKEQLRNLVEESLEGDEVVLTISRLDEIIEVAIIPINSYETGDNKIGLWVRDSTQGIGTVTYISEDKKKYAALGHGILDIDTKQLMKVKEGEVSFTNILSVNKGKKGTPGELIGEISGYEKFGTIEKNTGLGVVGYIDDNFEKNNSNFQGKLVEVGKKENIEIGKAVILSNINNKGIKEYEIFIDKINIKNNNGKGITLTIVEEELINKTGGIVQGMSGSPILQNGKIIGAITHVFVQNPEKGYGIFIEDMIKIGELSKEI